MYYSKNTVVAILIVANVASIVYGLECFTCENAATNEECERTGKTETCRWNEQSCQTEVRTNNNVQRIFKKCHQSLACQNNALQNDRPAWNPTQCNTEGMSSVCRCCCDTDLCNELLCGEPEDDFPFPPIDQRSDAECPFIPLNEPVQRVCQQKEPSEFFIKSGDLCTFSCPGNMRLFQGSGRVTGGKLEAGCAEFGWDRDIVGLYCKCPLSNFQNGEETCPDNASDEYKCGYACKPGYQMQKGGVVTRSCSKGIWDQPLPICYRECNLMDLAVANAEVACDDGNRHQSKCALECLPNYTPVSISATVAICEIRIGTGIMQWDRKLSECRLQICPVIDTILPYGSVTCSNENKVGSACIYTCDAGYDLFPAGPNYFYSKECLKSGNWLPTAPTQPCCARSCPENAEVDLIFLLDSSSSVGERNFYITKEFVKETIQKYTLSTTVTQVAVLKYNGVVDASSQIYFTTYGSKNELSRRIDNIPYSGKGTKTGDALYFVLEHLVDNDYNGRRKNVPLYLILITDGMSQDRVERPVEFLYQHNTEIILIPVKKEGEAISSGQERQMEKLVNGQKDKILRNGLELGYSAFNDDLRQATSQALNNIICSNMKKCA